MKQVNKKFNNHLPIIVVDWRKDFIKRFQSESRRSKKDFSYLDALIISNNLRTNFDELMIEYITFINSNPLQENDYYKYADSYLKGKPLSLKYFKHDVDKLLDYYGKIDKGERLSFNKSAYNNYVLYMMLKLKGYYKKEYNCFFNVKNKDGREYNPLCSIPSVLRRNLPFEVKEYDIRRAFPTFIDNSLGIERKYDVYDIIKKIEFNTLINCHCGIKGITIEKIRKGLEPVYGCKVNDVITDERFNEKGRLFKDFVVEEEKAIKKFIKVNKIRDYVRLHDGVFVLSNIIAKKLSFHSIEFVLKNCIKPEIINSNLTFYRFQNWELITTPKLYSEFFEQENFVRITEKNQDRITIFKDTNNVIEPYNHKSDILSFLKENINENKTDEIENRLVKDIFKVIPGSYLLLTPKPLIYYTDDKKSFGLSFNNGFAKYSNKKNEVVMILYSDVNGFFAPHFTQNHKFIFEDTHEVSVFEQFLTMACTGKDPRCADLTIKDKTTLINFCSMIGYLCQTYKNPSFCPAIILSDEGADNEKRKGGRGKTILTQAIMYVQNGILKGGKEFDSNYRHNFDDLHKSHKVYVIDDVPACFNYNDLYTNISGDISCGRKGISSEIIPFQETPKFIITTNWAVRYDHEAQSTNRRFYEYKFTNFFNQDLKPEDIFKHTFFDDWDKDEWNRFYNFIFYCVGLYLQYGMERIEYDKNEDNFMAYFNNDAILHEFERIFSEISCNEVGFNVSAFEERYKYYHNPVKNEGYFHRNNIKKLVDVYINYHKLPFYYVTKERRWKKIEELGLDLS